MIPFCYQIFQPVDPETERLALKAAQSLIRTLYPPSTLSDSAPKLDGLAVDVVQECKKILREPEKNQAQHAIKVLGALVGTTGEPFFRGPRAQFLLMPIEPVSLKWLSVNTPWKKASSIS